MNDQDEKKPPARRGGRCAKATLAVALLASMGIEVPGPGETLCQGCGKAVSKDARSCPRCGEVVKRGNQDGP